MFYPMHIRQTHQYVNIRAQRLIILLIAYVLKLQFNLAVKGY
ncbi:hypothetical protein SAMN03080601_03166 [Alkalitalea saponilacus]|uniref:Uncharacterized protein n=1 Tax=Alkalitalea saponilacus TaxID=889453 RepID=A0A1T5HTL1_9BACT|nr:hypothetical protein SAMN03080601_03166 [Alkalitalea saponilacus]